LYVVLYFIAISIVVSIAFEVAITASARVFLVFSSLIIHIIEKLHDSYHLIKENMRRYERESIKAKVFLKGYTTPKET